MVSSSSTVTDSLPTPAAVGGASCDTGPTGAHNEPPPKRRKPNSHEHLTFAAGTFGDSFGPSASRQLQTEQTFGQELQANLTALAGFENAAMLPFLEYTGPDFGFNNPQPANLEEGEYLRLPVSDSLYTSQPGTVGNMPWDAMVYGMMGNSDNWGAGDFTGS